MRLAVSQIHGAVARRAGPGDRCQERTQGPNPGARAGRLRGEDQASPGHPSPTKEHPHGCHYREITAPKAMPEFDSSRGGSCGPACPHRRDPFPEREPAKIHRRPSVGKHRPRRASSWRQSIRKNKGAAETPSAVPDRDRRSRCSASLAIASRVMRTRCRCSSSMAGRVPVVEMLTVIGPLTNPTAAPAARRVRLGDPVDPGLRALGHRRGAAGSSASRPGGADEAPRIHALCRARWLGA